MHLRTITELDVQEPTTVASFRALHSQPHISLDERDTFNLAGQDPLY